jgi:hypothetical protein
MRILSVVLTVAAAGCISNPDVRARDAHSMLTDGHGGWVVITHRNQQLSRGELIAVEPRGLRVLELGALVYEPFEDINAAELFEYHTETGTLGIWGTVGSLSTVSHGFVAVFSLPIWLVTSITATSLESRAAHLEYPGDPWSEFGSWARFPQGLPPNVLASDLLHQDRRPIQPAPPPVEPPPVEPPLAPPGESPP